MNESSASRALSHTMSQEAAIARIASYRKRLGEPHLFLAYHAAFPLALTPELLYRLWANFQLDILGKRLHIPWVAVADLLLSNLCIEAGHELYEMDIVVRNVLLTHLEESPKFGDHRITELSHFLLAYVQQQLDSHDPDIRDFAQVQQWAALSYTNPIDTARELAQALHSSMTRNDKAEQIRIASLIETFAEPLAKSTPLLMEYVQGMRYLISGDIAGATGQFNKIAEKEPFVQVQGVRLPIPGRVLQRLKGIQSNAIDPVQITQLIKDTLLSRQVEPTQEVMHLEILQQKVAAYRTSLTISTREHAPMEWALVQNNLGITLFEVAMLLVGEERAKTLYEAITCYDAAITVYSFEKTPAEWATTQSNKADALRYLADVVIGVVKGKMLQKAITCYKSSLEIYSRDGSPLDWARTHYNLGHAYSALTDGDRQASLEQSIIHLNESLRVFTLDEFPIDYALVRSNLGNIYLERKAGVHAANLEQALELYRRALNVFSRNAYPTQWATVQINLGKVYQMRIEGEWQVNLKRAITCYRNALLIYTDDAYPDQWDVINKSLKSIDEILPDERELKLQIETNPLLHFSDLYSHYKDEIYSYAFKATSDADTAEDVVQETMLRAYQSFKKSISIQLVGPWLTTIARRICVDLSRSSLNRRDYNKSLEGLYNEEDTYFDIAADWDTQTEVVAVENIFQDTLFVWLAKEIINFPEKQRIALFIDLANLMHFGPQPTPLQGAFLNVGIKLEDYQQLFPKDPYRALSSCIKTEACVSANCKSN